MSNNNINNKYFSLALSIDCVVFGFDEEELKILLIERLEEPYKNYWSLPGNLLELDEDLNDSAHRVLKELTGLSNVYLEQVETFGKIKKYSTGRVLTVSY